MDITAAGGLNVTFKALAMHLFIYYAKSYSKYNTHTHKNIKLKIKND